MPVALNGNVHPSLVVTVDCTTDLLKNKNKKLSVRDRNREVLLRISLIVIKQNKTVKLS